MQSAKIATKTFFEVKPVPGNYLNKFFCDFELIGGHFIRQNFVFWKVLI
jgi:hypothetical protein